MPKRPIKRTRDENVFAKSVVDSILEELEAEPQPAKDPRAVQRGRQGGSKGGKARAEKLSTKERSRQNLTIRMSMRRMTRLTNAFSKKWENLRAAFGLQFTHYNFCRIHKTLRCTPAMEAGISNHIWELRELLK
jgi:hypothetical protein